MYMDTKKIIASIYNLFIRDPAGYLVEIQAFLDPAWPALPPAVSADQSNSLVAMTASQVVAQLRLGTITPAQLIDAFLARHSQTDVAVNAVPTLCIERARAVAAAMARKGHPTQPPPGYLFGLPVVIKDLTDVEGVQTTRGSPIYRDNTATSSDPIVLELERKGAIIVGKSNTPEWGAGSNTFNEVFGATVCPFDVRRSAGGKGLLSRFCATIREILDFNREIYGTNRESVCINRLFRWCCRRLGVGHRLAGHRLGPRRLATNSGLVQWSVWVPSFSWSCLQGCHGRRRHKFCVPAFDQRSNGSDSC
eukprot:SAG31_NODE_4493_length_3188_cov_2.660084_4_plen_307_part_00